ncbi:MAG: nuclear transport factor 2 family protein [Chloroflexi bacterium]|nr:nuclear transport factor 2 family protein [Chloroflexota bacterium]
MNAIRFVLLLGLLAACAPAPAQSPPTSVPAQAPTAAAQDAAAVLTGFVNAYNAKDLDTAMGLLADDAVYTVFTGVQYKGKDEIRPVFQNDVSRGTQWEISNIKAAGDKVTYHMKILRFGGLVAEFDSETRVQDGKIKSLP